jgi:hypothetical protein
MEKNKVDFARESLGKYKFPDSFSPPYNPLVTMGNLDITKCRVMDSKKVSSCHVFGKAISVAMFSVESPVYLGE